MRKKRTGTDRCSFSFICFGSKKGQITIFIILGILLLLGLVLVLTLKSEVITFNPDEVILTEKGKIETFILSCIKEVGEEAVFLVGLQGGYIEAPQTALSLPVSPAHSIPYWAYGETTNIPTLEQIKQRIDTYVVDNLRSCILNLEPFQITYDITEKSPLTVETDITEQKILYNVHWDLEVQDKAGRVVAEVLNHVTESPIKLKRLYDVATLLVDKEMAELKLEDITQDLIAIGHEDVPVAGFEVSCKKRKWSVQQAELSLQDLLRINLGQLQVKNSAFAEFSDQYPYYQSHYQWNLGQDFSQPDVSVAFNFDNTYPFTFNVRPTSGDKMTSNQLGGGHELIDFLCLQNWKFVYDISYPVMIDLRDDTTNYRFKIALTVHLANNLPDRSGALLPQPQYEVDSFTDDEFCADRRIPMTAYTYELIENPYTGVYVREPLDNVALAFSCLRYSCDVGDTDLSTGLDNVATLRTNFPYCAGGILRGEKEGYKDGWERVFTGPDKNVEVDLVPLLEIPLDRITVLKHPLDDLTITEELTDEDTVLIKIMFSKPEDIDPFHESNLAFSPDLDRRLLEEQVLTLLAEADFTYDVEINIMRDQEFIGGYVGEWDLSWFEMLQAEGIIFHTITDEDAGQPDRFELAIGLAEQSNQIPAPEVE